MFLPLYGKGTLNSWTSGKLNLPRCEKFHQFFGCLCDSIQQGFCTEDYDARHEHHELFQANCKKLSFLYIVGDNKKL